MLGARQKMGKSRQDIFTHLLGEDGESGLKFTQAQLLINTQMLMVAGSGSSATSSQITIHKPKLTIVPIRYNICNPDVLIQASLHAPGEAAEIVQGNYGSLP